MKLSIKDKAKGKYRAAKRTVAKQLGTLEKRAAKLDRNLSVKAGKRGEQLAGKLEQVAARIRRTLAK